MVGVTQAVRICPNCGDEMSFLQTTRHETQQGQVTTRWLLCPHCRHVSLSAWHRGQEGAAAGSEEV